MSAHTAMSVRFWGVRGSIASPGPDTARYGANTACVEVRCGDHVLICDAGTGLRPLGRAIVDEGKPVDIDLLCSHTHIDHICGFPFFAPCYKAGNRIRIWGGPTTDGDGVESAFHKSMSPPLFPDVSEFFAADIEFKSFQRGDVLTPRPGITVRTASLNHPGGATGYRIEWQGKALAYVTDTEHVGDGLDPHVLTLIAGADAVIYDSNYTDHDYVAHVGWGHSTWQHAIRLAERAAVGTLALYHHDPVRTDAALDEIAAAADRMRPGTIVAREGLQLTL